MFLHLGNDFLISTENIIAIINLDQEQQLNRTTKDIIELGIAERKLTRISDKEKSLIITDDKIYLSPISSTTLQKRWQEPYKEG